VNSNGELVRFWGALKCCSSAKGLMPLINSNLNDFIEIVEHHWAQAKQIPEWTAYKQCE